MWIDGHSPSDFKLLIAAWQCHARGRLGSGCRPRHGVATTGSAPAHRGEL